MHLDCKSELQKSFIVLVNRFKARLAEDLRCHSREKVVQTRRLLKLAEDCLGNVIVRDENLPQNICKPCERQLLNYKTFKESIVKSQDTVKS